MASRPPVLRVGLADDHPVFRVGLRRVLETAPELAVRWDVGTIREALWRLRSDPVDLVIMDATLDSPGDGIEATRAIIASHAEVRVLVLSGAFDETVERDALAAGAARYLAKDLPAERIIRAVVESGDAHRPGQPRVRRPRQAEGALTRREWEVLDHIAVGRTNREISQSLGISLPTVNKHVHEILGKLGVRNRVQAASVSRGSLPPRHEARVSGGKREAPGGKAGGARGRR
ncbi:MAG: response regulator transcription factor [Candidatus Dormibacteraceae bacterium]